MKNNAYIILLFLEIQSFGRQTLPGNSKIPSKIIWKVDICGNGVILFVESKSF